MTPYHSKYFAYELTRRYSSDSVDKFASALVDAQVDLNPHQVEAALFAFRSPLSKGALLADEVGLGKTIEAGLVISQKWAERKRRILIITPSNLRKQWHQELLEKFFLSCTILETKNYNYEIKLGNFKPFEPKDSIVICSYQFARNKATDVHNTKWDLVVVDEAHRLRNVYKPSNIIANTLKSALKDSPILLLTATPLQNSILELFGLVSFIDEHAFGDLKSFREQFTSLNEQSVFDTLKARLKPICHRTLRKQVTDYIPFTKRHSIVEAFTPEESEDRLYEMVSEYLRRDNLKALPNSQRSLMTLVLRKLLASSTFAIAGAISSMSQRLQDKLKLSEPKDLVEELDKDFETLDETADEWDDEKLEPETLSNDEVLAIKNEINDLEEFKSLATSITQNAKGKALLVALERAFKETERLGAARKAIIFTESRRTQEYLLRVLADSSLDDKIVLFNGSNNDERSKKIYAEWFAKHDGTDKITGSRTADMRSALVDYFRDQGQIMIATEAGAEGINLQFCSLVVNYDLPWNPQRIEQRIGRCHRYGQKHDVVVVNFLNKNNEADQHVFDLLATKFSLFEGVFGASDEILGSIESGVDFEKRIAAIYQKCRTSEEIKSSFEQLQLELNAQISDAITKTRQKLLENFDEEVHEKLKINKDRSTNSLNRYEKLLMDLTKYELEEYAEFNDGDSSFNLKSLPSLTNTKDFPLGLYELPRRTGEAHLYRMGHPLAQFVLGKAKSHKPDTALITFDYSRHLPKITALEQFAGKQGELLISAFTVESLDQIEDHLLFSALSENGEPLDEDVAKRLFSLSVISIDQIDLDRKEKIYNRIEEQKREVLKNISKRNADFFEIEAVKLDGWAEDLKLALEKEIKDFDRQIKEAKRASLVALTLEEKLAGQKQIKSLELLRNTKRKTLFEAQDEIDKRRGELIDQIENKLKQKTNAEDLFLIRWRLV